MTNVKENIDKFKPLINNESPQEQVGLLAPEIAAIVVDHSQIPRLILQLEEERPKVESLKSKIAELIRRILENNLLDEDVETISFRGWEAAAVVAVFTKGVSDLSLSENSRTKGSGPVSYDTTYILYDIVGPNDQSFGQMFVEQDLGSSPQVCSIAQSMKKTFDIYQ